MTEELTKEQEETNRRARIERDKLYDKHYHPDNPAEFEHYFPTGKIIIANDLRYLFREGISYDVNGYEGMIHTTSDYAKLGMAHYYVGNSCPSVYYDQKRGLVVGTTAEYAYDCKGDSSNSGRLPYRKIGGVCTDLWWVSIMDEEDYFRLGGTPEALEDAYVDRAVIEPGRYVGRGFYGYKNYHAPNYHEFGKAGVMVALVRSDEPLKPRWVHPLTAIKNKLEEHHLVDSVRTFDSSYNREYTRLPADKIYKHKDSDITITLEGIDLRIKHSFNFTQIIDGSAYDHLIKRVEAMVAFYADPIGYMEVADEVDMDMFYRYLSRSSSIWTKGNPLTNLLNYGQRTMPKEVEEKMKLSDNLLDRMLAELDEEEDHDI